MYTYDSIMEVPDEEELRQILADIKVEGLDITEELYIKDFLVVNIDKVYSDTYHLSKSQLINQIVSDMGLSNSNATPRTTLALTTNILEKSSECRKIDHHFQYLSFIVRINYLDKNT